MITDRNVPLPQNWSNFLACSQNKSKNANFLSVGLKWQAPYDKQIVTSAASMMNWKYGHPTILWILVNSVQHKRRQIPELFFMP